MKTIVSILIFFTTSISHLLIAQTRGLPANAAPGKCLTKAMAPHSSSSYFVTLPIFTGENFEIPEIKFVELQISNATAQWVLKQQANKKEKVWCLVELEEQIEEIYVVRDTTKIKSFVLETFEVTRYNEDGGFKAWKEIVCDEKLKKKVILQIERSLQSEGFYDYECKGLNSENLRNCLSQFQKDKGLSVGGFTIETMEALGVYVH